LVPARRRAGRGGADRAAPWALSTAPRHAHVAGFDLHANVDVRAPRIAIGWSNYR
jgi:hypothetical protein